MSSMTQKTKDLKNVMVIFNWLQYKSVGLYLIWSSSCQRACQRREQRYGHQRIGVLQMMASNFHWDCDGQWIITLIPVFWSSFRLFVNLNELKPTQGHCTVDDRRREPEWLSQPLGWVSDPGCRREVEPLWKVNWAHLGFRWGLHPFLSLCQGNQYMLWHVSSWHSSKD